MGICSLCNSIVQSKGLCARHYKQKYSKEHHEELRIKKNIYIRKIKEESPERYKEIMKKTYVRSKPYRIKNRIRRNAQFRELLHKKRADIINFLGGKCVRCGFIDFRALQIDHINGGGIKEKNLMSNPLKYYKVICNNPQKYQLLCANCNWIKRYENHESKKIAT